MGLDLFRHSLCSSNGTLHERLDAGAGATATILLTRLFSQPVACDGRAVSLDVILAQVGKKSPAAADHLQEAAARMVIVLMRAQMIGQRIDPLGQERNLHFRRTRIGAVYTSLRDDGFLLSFFERHAGVASKNVEQLQRTNRLLVQMSQSASIPLASAGRRGRNHHSLQSLLIVP